MSEIKTLFENQISELAMIELADKYPKEFEEIKFPDIKFITDKTIIIKGTDNGLDEVIEFLKKHPHIIIEISGHTDNEGTDEKNMDLSYRRADKVKSIIVHAGVNTNIYKNTTFVYIT